MPDDTPHSLVGVGSSRGGTGGRWFRLCQKELRETLRDRRTLVTLILMPVLVYPILSMVLQNSLMSAWSGQSQQLLIGVKSKETADLLRNNLLVGEIYLRKKKGRETGSNSQAKSQSGEASDSTAQKSPSPAAGFQNLLSADDRSIEEVSFVQSDDLEAQLQAEKIDLGVLSPKETNSGFFELVHREGSALSNRTLQFVEQRLAATNELTLRNRLRAVGRSGHLPFRSQRRAIEVDSRDTTLSTVVPMILILMTLTGAVYPAIDLTAGERERGTLEMLMASPVPRLKLLMAKYVAVVTVAFLTALVNLTAMVVTLQATGLSRVLFGESGLSAERVLQILALLVLFAAFFSAVLLALTSFAKSFKEAQAYLIPLMLLSLGPGVVSLLPGLQLKGILAITPVSNMVLLARDLCNNEVNATMAAVAVFATALYTLAAIGVAAKIFGADAVMSGGQAELKNLFSRQKNVHGVSSVSGALLCLAVLFPIYFLTSSVLGQLANLTIPVRLALSGIATSLLFGVVPGVASRLQRVHLPTAFALQGANPAFFTVALLLGVTLWPIAHEIVLFTNSLGLASIRPEKLTAAQQLLEELRRAPLALILLSMAVAPAVFEELFFRGYLFSAFRKATSRRNTILMSAILFGAFHVISNSALSIERLLPSTFMGVVLGWLCYRSGSVLPGMLLHGCHNGILMLFAYYKEELASFGFGVEEQSHMPASWIVTSIFSLVVGAVLIGLLPPRDS